MPKKERRKFTEKELNQLEGWAAIRLPHGQMASLLGLSDTWFAQMVRDSEAAQLVIRQGESKSSAAVRQTLYQRAVGSKGRWVKNEETGAEVYVPGVEPDQRAIEFWCRTQEGMRTTERVELTGADGVPLGELTEEQADQRLEKLLKRLEGRKRHAQLGEG